MGPLLGLFAPQAGILDTVLENNGGNQFPEADNS